MRISAVYRHRCAPGAGGTVRGFVARGDKRAELTLEQIMGSHEVGAQLAHLAGVDRLDGPGQLTHRGQARLGGIDESGTAAGLLGG